MAAANAVGARSKDVYRWKKSSKVVEAEMCNKVAARHLVLIMRILDREKAHHAFYVEKEKRAVKNAMQAMKDNTTGESELGEAPSSPDDSDYRDSPYFLTSAGVISEKHLQKWRAMDKQMTRELKADAESGLLEPPWRTDPYKNIEQSFEQLLDGLGYEEEAALVKYLKTRERRSFVTPPRRKSSAAAAAGVRTRCDVFACLRRSDCACGDSLSGENETPGERRFSVKRWERAASREYIAAVTRKRSSETQWPKPKSSFPIPTRFDSTNDVLQLVEASDSADAVPHGENSGRDSPTRRRAVKPRSAGFFRLMTTPWTAEGITKNPTAARPQTSDCRRRAPPTSASVVGANADPSDRSVGATETRSAGTAWTLNAGYDAYARCNPRVNHSPVEGKPREGTRKKPKRDKCRPKTAPHGARGRDFGEAGLSPRVRSATAWRNRTSGYFSGELRNVAGSEKRLTHHKRDTAQYKIKTNTKSCTETTTTNSDSTASPHNAPSGAVAKATSSDVSKLISEPIEEVATPACSDDDSFLQKSSASSSSSSPRYSSALGSAACSPKTSQNPRPKRQNSSRKSKSHRPTPKNPGTNTPSPRPNQQNASSNPQSPRSNPQNSNSNPQSPTPNKETTNPNPNTTSDYPAPRTNIRRLPQWKRDLMAEAPPGVFSNRESVKVSVVMSKSQRQRELDQLVEENLSDVRTLVMRERARRMKARLNVFITVDTIQHAVAALKETIDRQ